MLSHFRKINSPLQAIGNYPSLKSQVDRFLSCEWKSVNACDFYGAWCNLITQSEKEFVESTEAFDEHEDFVLFCQHYFFLCASATSSKYDPIGIDPWSGGDWCSCKDGAIATDAALENGIPDSERPVRLHWEKSPSFKIGRRKLGAAAWVGPNKSVYYGGSDNKSRLSSTVLLDHPSQAVVDATLGETPSQRVCHTLTAIGSGKVLLVGGRGSPNSALKDCWMYSATEWKRVQDMPSSRYRHSAVCMSIGEEIGVMVFGGRGSNNIVYDNWLFWSETKGWQEIPSSSISQPEARFSAPIVWLPGSNRGLLCGGFSQTVDVLSDTWSWSLEEGRLNFYRWNNLSTDLIYRGGAHMVSIDGSKAIVFGGVSGRRCLAGDHTGEFVLIDEDSREIKALAIETNSEEQKAPSLLVGFSSLWENGQLAIIGGGITAFR
ncbi:hypothetical protein ABW19_dt0206975 [Dactylella cylindrospora]|nr:hypothetical protein ABW19_dt0206975 [Dactylella cylindrospora]